MARCFSMSTVSTVFKCAPLTAFPWRRHLSPWKPWWTPYNCILLLSGWYQANVPGLLGYWTHTLLFWLGPQLSSSLQEFMQLCTCVDMDTGSRWLRNRYKIQTGGLEPISFPELNQGSHFLRARELPFPDVALVSFIPSALDRQFLECALRLKSEVTPWAKSCYQNRIISYEVSRILYV